MTIDQRAALLAKLQDKLSDAVGNVGSAQVFAASVASGVDEWAVEQELIQVQQTLQRLQAAVVSMANTKEAE